MAKRLSAEKRLPVVGRIPFDPAFVASMVQGKTINEFDPDSKACRAIGDMWQAILETPIMKNNQGR